MLARLLDKYGDSAAEFGRVAVLWQGDGAVRNDATWEQAKHARERADADWRAIEDHVREHRCMELISSENRVNEETHTPEPCNEADFMLVADNTRRFIGATERAEASLGLRREAILGRCIEDLFAEAGGRPVATAWADFVHNGVQRGVCTTVAALGSRRFYYRAQANFAPGFHVCVLREAINE